MVKSTVVAVMMKAFIVVWTFRYVQSAGSVLILYSGLSVYFSIHKSTTGVKHAYFTLHAVTYRL